MRIIGSSVSVWIGHSARGSRTHSRQVGLELVLDGAAAAVERR